MRLVNAFCRLVEIAADQSPAPPPALAERAPVAVVVGGGNGADLLLFPELGPTDRRRAGRP